MILLAAALNPVLLVHGIDDGAATWGHHQARLEAAGWSTRAFSMTPNNGDASLALLAEQVEANARELLAHSGRSRLDVVAFSLGTIATRYWLQRRGGADVVDRFVAISGPHHGTLTGYLRWNTGGAELRPGSAFLGDLARDWDQTAQKVSVTSIYTPFDLMIIPWTSSRLEGATQVPVSVLLHPWMMSDPAVTEAVMNALRQALPAR